MPRSIHAPGVVRLLGFFTNMLLCIGLAAWSGGGALAAGGGPGAMPSVMRNISAERTQTAAGGGAVVLTASDTGGVAVEWMLEPGSPGRLDRASGHMARYIPPAAGTIDADTVVNVIATAGQARTRIGILLAANRSAPANIENAEDTRSAVAAAATDRSALFLLAGNDFGAGLANGQGARARFNGPTGITRDPAGNLYVADRFNHAIRKIAPDGTVTTFAGLTGVPGSADGAGTAARFNAPYGIAIDAAGNLYVTDGGNATIRKISPAGMVMTLAGSPGIAGSADGVGANARFGGGAMDLAVDTGGNLFVTERTRIRRVTPAGEVTTFVGSLNVGTANDGPIASASFNGLRGITIDRAGNLYVVDAEFTRVGSLPGGFSFAVSASVRRISSDGIVSTLAGRPGVGSADDVLGSADGAGTSARFRFPEGIAIDTSGNLYVADRGNATVRKITSAGVVSTIAGAAGQIGSADGAGPTARFASPSGIATDGDGTLYVTDRDNHTVRRIAADGAVTTLAGAAPRAGSADGARLSALFNGPQGITRDMRRNLYVADTGNNTIRRITPAGMVTTLAGAALQAGNVDGAGPMARFNTPLGITVGPNANLFVADLGNQTIRRITQAGIVATLAGSPGSGFADGAGAAAGFREPQAIVSDAAGNLFVVDRAGSSIRKVTQAGVVTTLAGMDEAEGFADGTGGAARFALPQDIAADGAGNLYVIDNGATIRKITPAGAVTTLAGSPFQRGSADGVGNAARFEMPRGIAADPDGTLYVADQNAIRRITPQGEVVTIAGITAEHPEDGVAPTLFQPQRLTFIEPKRLAITSGNGVFELRLP